MAAPDIQALATALKNADAAGDVEAARKLASALQAASSPPRSLKQQNPGEYDPQSSEFQDKYGPLSGTSNLENFRAGAGKAFPDLWRGIKQFSIDAIHPSSNASAGLRKEQDEITLRDSPLMSRKAAIAGNITGNVAAAAPTMFIPGINTYTGAAAIGAGVGALQPVGSNQSRLPNAALGAAGGAAGKYVGGKVGDWAARVRQPMSSEAQAAARAAAETQGGEALAANTMSGSLNARLTGGGSTFGTVGDDTSAALTRAQQKLLSRGNELGMKFTPGQATGSRALQQLEAKLESQPMTSGPFNALKAGNQKALAREVAASIGESSDTVDDVVLNRAASRLGQVFESAKDDVARPIDPKGFLSFYSGIQEELRGISTGFTDNVLVNDLIKLAETGAATGKQLQPLTSKLGKAAYNAMTSKDGNRDLGMALYRVKDYVDDLLQSGMPSKAAQKFGEARGQYRNLMNLLSRTNIINPSSGTVNGRALAQMLQQKDRSGFTLGNNKTGMYDAARIAQAFPPVVGDSGTATRSMLDDPLKMALSLPFNLASRAYTSAPSVSLATGINSASRAAGPVARNLFGSAPFYAPYALPASGQVILPELVNQ